MKKMWAVVVLLFLAAGAFFFYFSTELKVVNALDEDEKAVVLANKIWKIHFSEKINEKSVTSKVIYVTNEEGKRLKTEIFLGNDQKTIYVSPPENGYALKAGTYTLHLGKDIQSVFGRKMISAKKFPFVVKETLPVVGSKAQLNDYFLKMIEEQKKQNRMFSGREIAAEKSSDTANLNSESNQDVSGTNVQVQGVDEADIVKTDGKHIFQASQNKVQIISALPAGQMKLTAEIKYDQKFMPYQLFLHGDRLVVIGHSYDDAIGQAQSSKRSSSDIAFAPMNEMLKAIVYDVRNPEKPKQIRVVELDGSYVSSRKVDGIIYLITAHHPNYWMLEKNDQLDIRPRYSDSNIGEEKISVDYKKIQYFPESKEANYTLVASFDLENLDKNAKISTYLGSGNEIYMSEKSLYMTVSNYLVRPLENMSEMVAPDTNIYKFKVTGMDVKFDSSAEVQGTVLNQFSMDEHDGYFRIVTTKGFAWDERKPSSNQLYILDENLRQVGELEELARGERIYSARFMDDRIYMVTFKETDPLFVIDASDPAKPKVLGELKIPGFSNYLHPYDENHLIGFGQDTKIISEKGSNTSPRIMTNGVKISLFDVSDMTNPKELFNEVIGGSGTYSPLNYDHKALLFSKKKNLFAFPISVYQNSEVNKYEQIFEFQGAYVYNIDLEEGFKLASKITHVDKKPIYEEWESGISRTLYIGDTLYALSPEKITAHDLKTYQKIGEVSLK